MVSKVIPKLNRLNCLLLKVFSFKANAHAIKRENHDCEKILDVGSK